MEKQRVFVGPAVAVFKGGRVLLGRTNTVGKGKWCFSGGAVEPGERAAEAAKRELKEEAGLDALELEFTGYVDTPYPPSQFWLTLFFRCSNFAGEVSTPEPHKNDGRSWFAKGALPSPLFGHTQAAFEKKLGLEGLSHA
ncbi:MAG: NUDIX hydrolase [Candidatus Norongarragalinales archaeon]